METCNTCEYRPQLECFNDEIRGFIIGAEDMAEISFQPEDDFNCKYWKEQPQ